jgi:hypothetical protein
MTTNLTSRSTWRASLRAATLTFGLAAVMAATWTVACGQAFAYTDPTPAATTPVSSLVGAQVSVRPLGAPEAGYSERHQYGVAGTTTITEVVSTVDSRGPVSHATGDTAMHFRYGRVDSY